MRNSLPTSQTSQQQTVAAHQAHAHAALGGGPGYETRDVSLAAIVKWIVALFVFISVASGFSLIMYKVLMRPGDEQKSQWPRGSVRRLPPEPSLQANPVPDIKNYRAAEDMSLTQSGADPDTGAIHIPIDRAVELTVSRGLPARPSAPPQDTSATIPTESGSGIETRTPIYRAPANIPTQATRPEESGLTIQRSTTNSAQTTPPVNPEGAYPGRQEPEAGVTPKR